MKKTIHIIISILMLAANAAQADKVIPTSNPELTFLLVESSGGPKGQPASLGAINPKTKKILWKSTLGWSTAFKVAASPDGKYLAIMIGDSRNNSRFQTTEGSGNTLFLLDGAKGNQLRSTDPLLGWKEAPWAHATWQDFDLSFFQDTLTIQGYAFSYPDHPDKIRFLRKYTLPDLKPVPDTPEKSGPNPSNSQNQKNPGS